MLEQAASGHRSVVVTDGEQRSALAAVRSLGRAGYLVHVCATRRGSLAGASRFTKGEYVVPDPLTDPDAFASAVGTVVGEVGAQVLLPMSEPALLAILPQRAGIACRIPFASTEQFERICDKASVLEAAARHGLAVPTQVLVASRADRAAMDLPTPSVLKPSRSVVGAKGKRQKTTVSYASTVAEVESALDSMGEDAFPVLCQQRIEGPGTAISVLLWNGELRAAFAHRRLREKPPSGGVSVLRESIPLDPELLARSLALLREFDWHGVAMVEYKVDARTGIPFLMEINGRFWGSLQLAIDAGVDFPLLLVRSALGDPVDPVMHYPAGVRTQWELGEIDHLLARLLHTSSSLALPRGAPSRLQTIGAVLGGLFSGAHAEVFSRDDMRPFMREAVDWLRRR